MLAHLQQRAAETLASERAVMLVTSGPAGLQASMTVCEADGVHLYLLLPRASEHLMNLASNASVVITAPRWQVRGQAKVIAPDVSTVSLTLMCTVGAEWCALVRIDPARLQIESSRRGEGGETIEFEGVP